MPRRLLQALAAIAAGFLAAALLAAPASATTFNQKYSHLTFPAKVTYSQDRILTLNGRYHWLSFGANQADPHPSPYDRYVSLHGRYQMLDRLVPWLGGYRHYSEFINFRTGGKVQIVSPLNEGNGLYYWGSWINNVRG